MPNAASSTKKITVSTQAELNDAYRALSEGSGGTILLEEGTAYSVVFSDWLDKNTDAAVVIRSADLQNRATIREVSLKDRENVTIEDTILYATREDLGRYQPLITIKDAENITLRNNEMASNASGAAGTEEAHTVGVGLGSIRESHGVVLEGNTISGFMHGLTLRDTYDTQILDNDFSKLQGDAIRLGGTSGMKIEGNHFHDFYGTPWDTNHPDVIQFWGTNIKVNNENIQIRENIMDMGGSAAYQMIFGQNEHRDTNGFKFTDVLIEHNVLYGAHAHMISLSDTEGAIVRNNTAIYSPDSYFLNSDGSKKISHMTGAIKLNGDSTGVIENNIGHSIDSIQANATMTVGDDRMASNYRNHFTNIEAGGSGDLRDITLLPGSEYNGVMGSRLTWYNPDSDTLTAVARVEVSDFDKSQVTLDAGLSYGPGAAEATYLWTFADGSSKTGKVVTHDFAATGLQEYTLTVKSPDGKTDKIARTVDIENTLSLEVVVQGDKVTSTEDSEISFAPIDDLKIEDGWISIGGSEKIQIDRGNDALFNLSSFNYELSIDPEDGASGIFLHQPKTMTAYIDEDGLVTFKLVTDAGTFEVTSDKAIFDDGKAHHLNLVFDGENKQIAIYADGVEVGSEDASGTTAAREFWGLTIGNTWQSTIDANIQNIKLSSEAADENQIKNNFDKLPKAEGEEAANIPGPGDDFIWVEWTSDEAWFSGLAPGADSGAAETAQAAFVQPPEEPAQEPDSTGVTGGVHTSDGDNDIFDFF